MHRVKPKSSIGVGGPCLRETLLLRKTSADRFGGGAVATFSIESRYRCSKLSPMILFTTSSLKFLLIGTRC
jgi:hypothetical protein